MNPDPEPLIPEPHVYESMQNQKNDRSRNMKSTILNTVRQIPYVSLLFTAAALVIHLYHPLRLQLLYSRKGLADLEIWRILTCHGVHLNGDHLLWSTLTFCVLGSICEIMDRKKYILSIGIAAVLIPVTLWLGMPDLKIYGGLSGLDCSLYALLIVLFIKREWHLRNWLWIMLYIVLLGLLLGKILYETTTGLTFFVDNTQTDMVPVPLSHLVGGLVGIAVGTSMAGRKSRQRLFLIPEPPCL
jgi:rhomboid family GlyGly-CTERM serine protease